jgi:hypothetical protein
MDDYKEEDDGGGRWKGKMRKSRKKTIAYVDRNLPGKCLSTSPLMRYCTPIFSSFNPSRISSLVSAILQQSRDTSLYTNIFGLQ